MNPTLVENSHGHGAIKDRRDLRDVRYGQISISPAFDWTLGYDAETALTPSKDQGKSYSCGGQAGAYLEALTKPLFSERSARYIYSQIFYPNSGGGTTLRDILTLLVNQGAAAESAVVSYQNGQAPSEMFMRDRTGNAQGVASAMNYEVAGYAFVAPDIDAYAQAIRDNGGAIMQVNGKNNGTWLSAIPTPPIKGATDTWSHFVVCTGAMMKNGRKCIKIHNSWGDHVGERGYQWISEDYFLAGQVLRGGTVYLKDSPQVVEQKITLYTQLIALYQELINILAKQVH